MYRRSAEIMKLVVLELDPKMQIGSCSVAQKQLIELAKVISDNVKVLIMDEPTSALNDVETEYPSLFIVFRFRRPLYRGCAGNEASGALNRMFRKRLNHAQEPLTNLSFQSIIINAHCMMHII